MAKNKTKRHKSPDNPLVKQFSQLLKASGFKGGKEAFAREILNMNSRDNLDYLLKSKGGFSDLEKHLIEMKLGGDKYRQYGIDEEGIELLSRVIDHKIPTNRDIIAEGDNIAINGSSVTNINEGKDWKRMYKRLEKDHKEALEILEGLKVENIKLKSSNETLRDLLNQ